jgi:uncharacterized protein involved in exopolysaccharide biosynthesis
MLGQQQSSAKLPPQVVADPDVLQKQLALLQDQLAALRSHYTDEHPDVRKTKKDIAQLEKRIEEGTTARGALVASTPQKDAIVVETPQAQQLRAQLYQINVSIREKTAQQARIQQEISTLQAKLRLTPAIAQEYKSLTRDYQTALSIYNDLLKKQSDSEMATDLERRQQGEQFRVLDPPSLPQKPTYPNRPMMTLAGLFGGLAFGLAIVFALEVQDTTLRSEHDVERILKLPTLAMIPLFGLPKGSNGHLTALLQQPTDPASVGSQ